MKDGDQLFGQFANLHALLQVQENGIRVAVFKSPPKEILYQSLMPIEDNFDKAKERALAFFMCELESMKRDEIKKGIRWRAPR